MLGVCCTCQETHPVRPASRRDEDFDDELDEFGEQAGYVMADHAPTFGFFQCEGTGTTPQALLLE